MSKIEWTNETWNPSAGCTKVSTGCKNCYAEKFAVRLAGNEKTSDYKKVVKDGKWNGKVIHRISALDKPNNWKKPRMVFVCSMGDLFHEASSFQFIDMVFSVMSDIDRHTYQILTKRPQRVYEFFKWKTKQVQENLGVNYWIPKENIWIGVTAENQETWNERVPILEKLPVRVRFVSCEPLLSHIDICIPWSRTKLIHWIICGSETGNGSRPMMFSWAASLREQCNERGIPFFFKKYKAGKNIVPFEDLPPQIQVREYPKVINQ